MKVTYNNLLIEYDEKRDVITVDGKIDNKKRFSPCFITDGKKGQDLIGINDNKEDVFINLTGKTLKSIKIEDVGL